MNTMRTILVPFNNTQPTATAVDAARLLAEPAGAYIEGAYCRQVLPVIAGEGITLPGDYLAEFEEEGKQQADAARAAFEVLLAERHIPLGTLDGLGIRAGWTEMIGTGPEGIGEYARTFSVSVLARSLSDGGQDWKSTAETLLFESGRPLLLVSTQLPEVLGRRVLVAWNGSTETARALTAAMPLLAGSEAVLVVTVAGGTVSGPDAEQICAHLCASGIPAQFKTMEAAATTVGQVILSEAAAFDADLIVKGAFTHSRLRQLIFGGATSEIFNHALCPVLMCH